VNEESAHETAEFINKKLVAIQNQRKLGDLEELALIIGMYLGELERWCPVHCC
jgi:hypothetical protein